MWAGWHVRRRASRVPRGLSFTVVLQSFQNGTPGDCARFYLTNDASIRLAS